MRLLLSRRTFFVTEVRREAMMANETDEGELKRLRVSETADSRRQGKPGERPKQ